MHKCVLKPLKPVIEAALRDFQLSSGTIQQLKENLLLAKAKQPQEMGVDGAQPPDPVAIEKIRHKFNNMCKMYSPEKKVSLLLSVCKLIYTIMENNSGAVLRCSCVNYNRDSRYGPYISQYFLGFIAITISVMIFYVYPLRDKKVWYLYREVLYFLFLNQQ